MGVKHLLIFVALNVLPGAPGRIRTRDPLLRRQLLYPAELQAPTERIVQDPGNAEDTSAGYGRDHAGWRAAPMTGVHGQDRRLSWLGGTGELA
jgi:hypothetical protein